MGPITPIVCRIIMPWDFRLHCIGLWWPEMWNIFIWIKDHNRACLLGGNCRDYCPDNHWWLSIHWTHLYIGTPSLTQWGQVTHICISKIITIGSDDGLSPGRHQAIIWTNVGILSIGPLGINFSEILIKINTFSFKKMHLTMLSAKRWLFRLSLNDLNEWQWLDWMTGCLFSSPGYGCQGDMP